MALCITFTLRRHSIYFSFSLWSIAYLSFSSLNFFSLESSLYFYLYFSYFVSSNCFNFFSVISLLNFSNSRILSFLFLSLSDYNFLSKLSISFLLFIISFTTFYSKIIYFFTLESFSSIFYSCYHVIENICYFFTHIFISML